MPGSGIAGAAVGREEADCFCPVEVQGQGERTGKVLLSHLSNSRIPRE